MNVTYSIVVEGVVLTIEAVHSVNYVGTQTLQAQVLRDGRQIGWERLITKPTGHFVTGDGMVDSAEPCNCGPNAACSNCPTSEVRMATAESALTAVYAAIEKEVDGYDNAGVLSGLADLVNALMSASVTEGRA
ncbi:MAG: hypothetical protein WBB10_27630 [Rhodococcus qingshengii]